MAKPAVLALAELIKIDQLSYNKANRILGEAQAHLRCLDYDLAVRRAQEAFELYLKSVFRFLQAEYPAIHDVKKEIYALTVAFKQQEIQPHQIEARQVARLVLANSMLHLWRLPAFYGDETLSVAGLFEEKRGEACAVVRRVRAGFVQHRSQPHL